MKRFVLVMLALFGAFGAFAESEVTVTGVTAQQRYPWNGKVDIAVSFTCAAEDREGVICNYAAPFALSQKRITLIGLGFSSEKRTVTDCAVEPL